MGTGVGSGKGVAGLGVFGAVAKSDGFMLAADSGLDEDIVDGGRRTRWEQTPPADAT